MGADRILIPMVRQLAAFFPDKVYPFRYSDGVTPYNRLNTFTK